MIPRKREMGDGFLPVWEIEREFKDLFLRVEKLMEEMFPFGHRFNDMMEEYVDTEEYEWEEEKETKKPSSITQGYIVPVVDVIKEPDDLTITAEMPGLAGLEEISVKIEEGRIYIRGEGEKKRYFVELPIDRELSAKSVRKHYKNGILELRLGNKGILESGAEALKKVEKSVERALKERSFSTPRSPSKKRKGGKGRKIKVR